MVQRRDEEDLVRRFSRVEQVKLERRRREKIERPFVPDANVMSNDPVKRVLFVPDQNLQGWIESELGKMAEFHKNEWNFDFKRGIPANLPSHNWSWERQDGPPAPMQSPVPRAAKPRAPWAAARTPSHPSRNLKLPRPAAAPSKSDSSQRKITDFLTARKYPNASGSAKLQQIGADFPSSDDDENDPTLAAQQ